MQKKKEKKRNITGGKAAIEVLPANFPTPWKRGGVPSVFVWSVHVFGVRAPTHVHKMSNFIKQQNSKYAAKDQEKMCLTF